VLARAVPIVLLVAAGAYLILSLQLPFGAAARPGAGFYPVFVAVFAVVVALGATTSAFRSAAPGAAAAVDLDAAVIDRVVAGAMPTSMLRCEGQFGQAGDGPVGAQHRVR